MESNYVLKVHCEEHGKRIEDEQKRQNKRIDAIEEEIKENRDLLVTINRLVDSVEAMQKELAKQGERLEAIENRDGDTWRAVKWSVLTLIIGAIVGYIMSNVGF